MRSILATAKIPQRHCTAQTAYYAMRPWKISNLPERNSTSSCDLEKNLVGAKVFLIYVSVSTSEINARKEGSERN